MRESWETMTSVSAGHIILTPTQPVGSGRDMVRIIYDQQWKYSKTTDFDVESLLKWPQSKLNLRGLTIFSFEFSYAFEDDSTLTKMWLHYTIIKNSYHTLAYI